MGYLGNGLTITGTQNSKRIVVDATPNQTISTVTGGYLVGQLDVYRNGVKLVDTQDYTASDGASVTFLNAASEGDELEFVVFENFDVANALAKEGGTVNGSLLVSTASTFSSDLTVDGNVTIGGTLTYEDVTNIDSVGLITARSGVEIGTPGIAATLTAAGGAVFTGVVTATSFVGDGSGLTGVASTDNINTSTLAQFTGGVGIADSIFHIGDDNTAIRFPAADTFTVETGGAEALRVQSDGDVGIGTINNSNNERLRVQDDATTSTVCQLSIISGNAERAVLNFGDKDDANIGRVTYDNRDNHLSLFTNNSEGLRIASDGDVGIGTTNPSTKLHLSSGSATQLTISNTSNSMSDGDTMGTVDFSAGSSNTVNARVGGLVEGTSEDGGDLTIETRASGGSLGERLRVTSDGDVGIGTQTPETPRGNRGLEVAGTTGAEIVATRFDDNITDGDFIGGFVFKNLDAGGTPNHFAGMYAKANGTAGSMDLHFTADRAQYEADTSDLTIRSGNIGIGTDNPSQQKLTIDVNSSGTAQASFDGINICNTDSTTNNGAAIIFGQAIAGNSYARIGVINSDRTGSSEDQDIFFATLGGGSYGERLRIGSLGQIGLGGANYGTAGQAIVSNGSGSAPTWQDVASGVSTHVGTASGIVTSVFLGDATDHKVTVTGFVTFTATQAGTEGESHTIRIVNSGIATVGFSTYFLFPSGAAPVLPTADGAVSLISFTVHDSVGAGCTQLLAGASLNFS